MSLNSLISDYDLTRTLGQGTFGKVKLGQHKQVQHYVALKILYKNRINDPDEVERISRQIAILKALNHQHVVQLYEMIENRDEIYLVMEYAEKGDMMQYIRAMDRIDEEEAAVLFLQIVQAVEYIHSVGIAHRDLKPSNILLTHKMQIKLADFGLSNTYKPGTRLTSSCGSPCYAAPEIIQAKAYDPLLADTWSMGVVLFFMVCGFLPFQHKNTHTLYKQILSAKFQIPKSISKLAGDLIMSLLRTNPNRRLRPSEIRSHPWIKLHTSKMIHRQMEMPNNDGLIEQVMAKLGYTYDNKKKHNKSYTIYQLLKLKTRQQLQNLLGKLKQQVRSQKKLNIEVNSPTHSDMKKSNTPKVFRRTPRQEMHRVRSGSRQSHCLNIHFMKLQNNSITSSTLSNKDSSVNQSIISNSSNVYQTHVPVFSPPESDRWTRRKIHFMQKKSLDEGISQTSIERKSSRSSCKLSRKQSFLKRDPSDGMDTYDGPLQLECIFTQPALQLKIKLLGYLKLHKVAIKELDKWRLETDQIKINICKLSCGPIYVRFSTALDNEPPIIHKIIIFLSENT